MVYTYNCIERNRLSIEEINPYSHANGWVVFKVAGHYREFSADPVASSQCDRIGFASLVRTQKLPAVANAIVDNNMQ